MIIIIQTNFFPLLKCLIYVINMNTLPIKLLVCTKHLNVEAHPFVGSNFQCFFKPNKRNIYPIQSVYTVRFFVVWWSIYRIQLDARRMLP